MMLVGLGTRDPSSVPLCTVGAGTGVDIVIRNTPSAPRVTDPCSKVTAVPPATAWTPLVG
jgi:hypothetical protein